MNNAECSSAFFSSPQLGLHCAALRHVLASSERWENNGGWESIADHGEEERESAPLLCSVLPIGLHQASMGATNMRWKKKRRRRNTRESHEKFTRPDYRWCRRYVWPRAGLCLGHVALLKHPSLGFLRSSLNFSQMRCHMFSFLQHSPCVGCSKESDEGNSAYCKSHVFCDCTYNYLLIWIYIYWRTSYSTNFDAYAMMLNGIHNTVYSNIVCQEICSGLWKLLQCCKSLGRAESPRLKPYVLMSSDKM